MGHDQGKTLAQIGELDLDELALWIAWYERHDPALDQDWRAGQIAATIANAHSRSRTFGPEDFFPNLKRLTRRSPEQMQKDVKAWCVNAGGTVTIEKRSDRP